MSVFVCVVQNEWISCYGAAPCCIPNITGMDTCVRVSVLLRVVKKVVISLNVVGSVRRVGGKEGLPFHRDQVHICVCVSSLRCKV